MRVARELVFVYADDILILDVRVRRREMIEIILALLGAFIVLGLLLIMTLGGDRRHEKDGDAWRA
ncbi:MAG TPA: hypothetical protein VJC20_04525 [Candidatus Paceibacterota bacterium]